jgi:hypothetical protein
MTVVSRRDVLAVLAAAGMAMTGCARPPAARVRVPQLPADG